MSLEWVGFRVQLKTAAKKGQAIMKIQRNGKRYVQSQSKVAGTSVQRPGLISRSNGAVFVGRCTPKEPSPPCRFKLQMATGLICRSAHTQSYTVSSPPGLLIPLNSPSYCFPNPLFFPLPRSMPTACHCAIRPKPISNILTSTTQALLPCWGETGQLCD